MSTMNTQLKYGMVGGGPGAFVGPVHRHAIRLDDSATLVAGCFSSDPAKNKVASAELHIGDDRTYADYAEMAAAESRRSDGIDFVVVVTPNHLHFPICEAFLLAGIHVVCDKPLALTKEECVRLMTLSKEKNLLFMVTYTYTGNVTVREARELIAAGRIGRIRMIAAEYPQSWLASPDQDGGKQGLWRRDPAQSGRVNALGDIGTHIENLVSYVTRLEIRRLLAKMDVLVPGRVLDDNDMVLLEYTNGASGMYWCSQVAFGQINGLRLRVFGDKGSLFWSQENSEELILNTETGRTEILRRGGDRISPEAARFQRTPAGHAEGWLEAMANLYVAYTETLRDVKSGKPIPTTPDFPTAADGVAGLSFVEACLESQANGSVWVDIAT